VNKAKEIGAKTDRERAYIDAISAFYQDWDKADHRTHSLSYERAMEKVYLQKLGPSVIWDQSLHAMDYLEYAYLQSGQDREARRVLDQLLAYQKAVPASLAAGYAIAAIPARYAVERRDWEMAALLSLPPVAFAWDRFPWTAAMVTYSRGLGAAHTGKIDEAKAELAKLQSVPDSLSVTKSSYWTDQVEVQRRSVSAALAQAEGRNEEALALMRLAAELEGVSDKNNVTPGSVAPARELLGDMLVAMGQPALALAEYERSLGTDPNRYRALAGAAHAHLLQYGAGRNEFEMIEH
jgi:hypothetical protein